jgi:cyclophilin family peptidyl-prolyl cis-trans isomerase/HEAT repeat protein
MAPLFRGLASKDPAVVVAAAWGIGRFENGAFLKRLTPLVGDPRLQVRIAVLHALGQLGQDTTAADLVAAMLIAVAEPATDPLVLGAAARSLGRLPVTQPGTVAKVGAALARLLERQGSAPYLVDVTRAIEAWSRRGGRGAGLAASTVNRLGQLAVLQAADAEAAARVRRAAVSTLTRVIHPDARLAAVASDPDPEVRRLAAIWAVDSVGAATRRDLVLTLLADKSPMVRLEALRAWGRRFQSLDCGPVLRARLDSAATVAIQAIDQLGDPCPAPANAGPILKTLADSAAATVHGYVGTLSRWHQGAHALVSLAKVAPGSARLILNRAAGSTIWQVRMYAARAAQIVGDAERLTALTEDRSDNVREAAVVGLSKVAGHGADSIIRAQLARPDYQLVMTSANALAGAIDRAKTVAALEAALARITRDRKDTSRDPRMALLERLGQLGGRDVAPRLESYLSDFDPRVAQRAAQLIHQWTGTLPKVTPRPLPKPALSIADALALRNVTLRVTMARSSGGGSFDIALDPEIAPATVLRIVAHARSGYYDGLTFHRMVPNFVIQGGSPGANEYTGDPNYLRDEIGPASHERGTLGISTRGRDTGDSQIFVNLVENLRLDFDYTVFGRVTSGLAVVDGVLEGDEIEKMSVVDGRHAKGQR